MTLRIRLSALISIIVAVGCSNQDDGQREGPDAGLDAGHPTSTERERLAADLEPALAAWVGDKVTDAGPGLAIAVVGSDGIIFSKCWGLANIAEQVAVTSSTPFELASVSKQFTALALMMLYEDGLLDPADPVADYFPEAPSSWDGMTIHHLLTHQAGFFDFLQDGLVTLDWTNANVLAFLTTDSRAVKHAPGLRYDYSNSGYVLGADLVERVSEMSFEDFMATRIFAPLDMRNSTITRGLPTDPPEQAQSYYPEGRLNLSVRHRTVGGSGQQSSLEDLAKWEISLRDATLVSQRTLDLMFTRHVLSDSGNGWTEYAGYGWFISDEDAINTVVIAHRGKRVGFHTLILRYPEWNLTFIMLSNGTYDWAYDFWQPLEAVVLQNEYDTNQL